MRNAKILLAGIILCFCLTSVGLPEDYDLQYFLSRASSKAEGLSKKEKGELLNRIGRVIEQALQIQEKLAKAIQTGEADIRYQDGNFWLSKLGQDKKLMETGIEQVRSLKEKPADLVESVKLYKSLKDLSFNFNTYNNVPLFAAFVGDLAPEIELWADPVFYKLYLLSLARSKEGESKPVPKEKKPTDSERKR